jgi:hypothetical protein
MKLKLDVIGIAKHDDPAVGPNRVIAVGDAFLVEACRPGVQFIVGWDEERDVVQPSPGLVKRLRVIGVVRLQTECGPIWKSKHRLTIRLSFERRDKLLKSEHLLVPTTACIKVTHRERDMRNGAEDRHR